SLAPPWSSAVRTTRAGDMLTTGCAFNVTFGRRVSGSRSLLSLSGFWASAARATVSKRHVTPDHVNHRRWLIAKTLWEELAGCTDCNPDGAVANGLSGIIDGC